MSELVINIDVPDLAAGIAFYDKGLGFGLCRLLFDGRVAEIQNAGQRLFLIEQAAGTTAVPDTAMARSYAPHWTPVHLDMAVVDLAAAVAQAKAAGATASAPVSEHAFGTLAPMRDPFGHGF